MKFNSYREGVPSRILSVKLALPAAVKYLKLELPNKSKVLFPCYLTYVAKIQSADAVFKSSVYL